MASKASILGVHIPGTSKKKGKPKVRVMYKPGQGLSARRNEIKALTDLIDKQQAGK